nr:hypothetical protein Iba_chr06cCG16610 [Ipomoea batatas]
MKFLLGIDPKENDERYLAMDMLNFNSSKAHLDQTITEKIGDKGKYDEMGHFFDTVILEVYAALSHDGHSQERGHTPRPIILGSVVAIREEFLMTTEVTRL